MLFGECIEKVETARVAAVEISLWLEIRTAFKARSSAFQWRVRFLFAVDRLRVSPNNLAADRRSPVNDGRGSP